ncbi:protein mono-ADP-ribosyltransferase PARP15-like [Callorhinchus milii]|uniref:protein mono-ADP-ribosyltransferase PARP15-like n=1 Tax=Callorhinchus milii TaxID=7868 RepID=UPI001C3FD896|nr:protein mono-ADP-ribosyltransferase PARP15-like [Callorhinchus milii]
MDFIRNRLFICFRRKRRSGGHQQPMKEPTITLQIGGVTVILKNGDITKESVDAIVNTTNKTLDLQSGVSEAILKAAGSSVKDECKKLGSQANDGIVVTGGGQLQCLYIVHMVGPTTAPLITAAVEKTLRICDHRNIATVAFPAIGTGKAGIDPQVAIKAIFDGMDNYFLTNMASNLKIITIVTFDTTVYDSFAAVFDECLQTYSGSSMVSVQSNSSNQSISPLVYPLGTLPFYPTVQIDGITVMLKQGDITKVGVDAIVNSTNKTMDMNYGASGAILEAAGSSVKNECKMLGSQPHDGVVVTGGGRLQCLYIMHMVGPKTVPFITAAVEKILEKCDQLNIATVAFPAIGTGNAGIDPRVAINAIFDGMENYLQTNTASNLKTITIVAFDTNVHDCFATVFDECLEMSSGSSMGTGARNSTNQISTISLQDLPQNWTPMNDQEYLDFTLQVGSAEYNKVADDFKTSCQNIVVKVIQIERIQNCKLWQSYSVRKETVDRKYPNGENEKILYHGTSRKTADKVKKLGFNRSFFGKNAARYGNGTYFAKNAKYSCDDKYSRPSNQGYKYIFRARVITGKMCLGKPSMKEPSPVDAYKDRTNLCDCAVDNTSNPSVFVIFCDDGAYPEYLITFKK